MRSSIAPACVMFGMVRTPMMVAPMMSLMCGAALGTGPTPTNGPPGGVVNAIADVGAPSAVVFVAAGGSVFRSNDAGLTWARGGVIGSGTRSAAVRALDAGIGVVYAGTFGEGVWRSADDGATWSNFSAGLPAGQDVSHVVLVGSRLFALVADPIFGPFLWRTDASTAQWTPSFGLSDELLDIDRVGSQLIASGIFAVYTSGDGVTFSQLPVDSPSGFPFLEHVAVRGERVVTRAALDELTFAADFGPGQFTLAEPGLPAGGVPSLGAGGGVFIAQTRLGVLRSADGNVWNAAGTAGGLPAGSGVFAVSDAGGAGNSLLLSTGTTLLRSSNGGLSFTRSDSGIVASTVAPLAAIGSGDGTTLLAGVLNSAMVHRSTDAGESWSTTTLPAPPSAQIRSVLAMPGVTLLGTFTHGLFRSTDNGATFASTTVGLPTYNGTAGFQFREFDFLASRGGVMLVGTGTSIERTGNEPPDQTGPSIVGAGVFRSTNNGVSWSAASSGLPSLGTNLQGQPLFQPITGLDALPTAVFAGTRMAGVFRSTTDGAGANAWTAVNNGLPMCGTAFPTFTAFAQLGNAVFAAASGFDAEVLCDTPPTVWRLDEQTQTWARADAGLPQVNALANDIVAFDGALFVTITVLQGTGSGVYRSDDAGVTWRREGGTGTPVFGPIAAGADRVFLGSVGAGVWTLSSCRADFNGDGQADFFDYLDFIAAFDANSLTADFNGDQTVDFFDYLDFVMEFDAGCA